LVLLRAVYIALIAGCSVFLTLHFFQRSSWYQQHLYKQLLGGNEAQRLRAASTLVQLGGQKHLLEAMKADQPDARAVAKKALEYLWFNAAGPKAFGLTQAAYHAAERREFGEALALLDRLTREYPNFAEGWNQRASVLWQMGEYRKSIKDSEHAIELNPNHYGAWQGMGVCRLKLGEIPAACRCLRAALKILPHDTATREALEKCEELLPKPAPVPPPSPGSELI
jgi:tetratricopeptide (TPR) repeat protein